MNSDFKVGHFTPTISVHDNALLIGLEVDQIRAVLEDAAIPQLSDRHHWGLSVLHEIKNHWEQVVKEKGSCEIRIVPRRYDGGVV